MAPRNLYATVTNTTNIRSISVQTSHDASTAIATIEADTTSLTLGDSVSIDLGYADEHQVVFTGYVKQIDQRVPDTVYSITCSDVMTRAMDYFIASSNPLEPLTYDHITAEELIRQLMLKAGLTSFTCPHPSLFTFGVTKSFEINLVPVFDYCRAIADNLTWAIWADSSGTVHFENRKPYPMVDEYPENIQAGWAVDPPPDFSFDEVISIDMAISTSEKNLRNRVVVYGEGEIYAEAKVEVPELPAGFYKTTVLGAPGLIDTDDLAQRIADFNLDLFCRYTQEARVTLLGKPSLACRTIIEADASYIGLTGNWYVDTCEHVLSASGYITSIGLRRMPKAI